MEQNNRCKNHGWARRLFSLSLFFSLRLKATYEGINRKDGSRLIETSYEYSNRMPVFTSEVSHKTVKENDSGHNAGTGCQKKPARKGRSGGTKDGKSVVLAFVPRLMDLHAAAHYLSVSYWVMRDLVQGGKIQAARLPCLYTYDEKLKARVAVTDGRCVRRTLIDRVDLDAFVDRLEKG